jgi:hypothetical protein
LDLCESYLKLFWADVLKTAQVIQTGCFTDILH